MLTAHRIRKRYGDYLCRRCLNREYRVHMQPCDCRYKTMRTCAICHSSNHLVVGFTARGLLKMLPKF